MKKTMSKFKFARHLMLGVMLLFCASWTMAQEFDTDVPMGWAVVPGYATDYTGGIQTTTGGAGGEVVTATSNSQLASYVGDDTPRIILVQGTLTGGDVNIGSNKTIIGVGSNAKLSGFYLNMNPSHNIIIRNLEISGGTDAIAARYTDHLWVDHCYMHNCDDGLLDITRESDRYNVTWCKFSDHHKCNLLNGGSTHTSDRGKINGTLHHNFYNATISRNPRAGFGMIHIFNDYNYSNSTYGIGFHTEARVLAERNYFKDMSKCIVQMYSDAAEQGDCLSRDNYFDNASGDQSTGIGFEPKDYYMYDFVMDNASDVASIVSAGAGPSAEFATIGLMPTPGQGVVKVTDGTLSWKTGIANPTSYKVYFGTTTNPPLVATTSGTTYNATLSSNTVYYWRVDQITSSGTIEGKLWFFSTGTGIVPPTPVSGVSVSPTTALVGIGTTSQLTETVAPSNATNKTVTWSSSNTSVATVSSSGVVSGVAAGSAVITVTTDDGGYTATCNVTVSAIAVSGVSISPASATVGISRTTQLAAVIAPSNATNKSVSWSSNNTSVATVSSSGVVTGVALGSAVITATTQDGGYTATSNITVVEYTLPDPLISIGFNENTGSSVSNTGTVSATFSKTDPPSWSTNVPTNGGAGSVDFGTSTGNYYVESSSAISELAGLGSFTVTGWVNNRNSSVGSGGNRIVSWINNGGDGVDIVYNSDGSLTTGINEWPDKSSAQSSSGKITTDANASASNWKFFAVTYDASSSTLKFYFGDNSTSASLDKTISYNKGTVGSSIGKLAIGHFNSESSRTSRTDRMFRGLIDQVDIYGEVLSLSDIQTAQNIGSVTVPVTGVTVAPTSVSVNIGATAQLTATVAPSNATNQSVSWSSGNTSVATVSSSGLVTGVAAGSATITVTTQDGNKTATSAITVNTASVPVTGVTVAPTSASVNVGATTQLTATVAPSDATNKTVSWGSSNTSIATVSSSGLVTGVAAGSATITVTTQDGNKTATSAITVNTVNVPVTGVTVSPTSASVNVGATTQLTATVAPSNATNKTVSWSSNSTSVATVSSSGLVTGVADGTATITVTTADGGYTATSNITVSTSSLPTPLIKLDFDDNSGSGVANTGSVSATFSKTDPPSWSSNVPTNGGVSSVDFGTSTGNYYVQSASTISELTGLSSFTVTGWVNNRSSSVGSGGNRIVSWIKNGGNGVDVVYNSDGSLTVGINQWPDNSSAQSSSGKITTNSGAPASNWKFFAVTYESGTVKFYFGDNSTAASLDKTISYNQGTVGTDIGKLAIGHFNDESSRTSRTNRMFRGLIDQVQIFGTALSASEIQTAQSVQSTPVSVTSVSISPTTLSLTLGDPCANNSTGTLSATVTPSNATNKNVTWTTSNSSVATVDNSGNVTAVGNGSAIITVTTEDGNKTATCNVNVSTVVPVYSVSISPASVTLDAGSTAQLTAAVLPACVSQNVSWSSGNTSVATVNSSGVVTGVAAGSTAITATTQDGGYSATSNVTVTQATNVTITLQENEDGFCSVDGSVDNNNAGFTGTGFANTDNSSGTGITWSVNVPSSGTYSLVWRYAHGKTGDRTGQVMADGSTVASNVSMQPTGSWTTWTETSATDISLSAGTHTIRLEATNSDGLANIDYMKITGSSPTPVACTGLKNAGLISGNSQDINVTVYPNPVNAVLNIEFNKELTGPVSIYLLDNTGRTVKFVQAADMINSFDISGLPNGLYLVKVSGSGINKVMHLVKQ